MQTEVEAFLQRIRAFPDDDAPRLILAEWLEEHALTPHFPSTPSTPSAQPEWTEARGRFIRIQIALARLQEEENREDSGFSRLDRESTQKELKDREKELHDLYKNDWEAPFHGLATGLRFSRGFVEEANVTARNLVRYAHELFAASPVRHIHLLDVGESLPDVFQCPYLSRLNALTVHASRKGEPLARAIARSEHLAGLKTLHLSRNEFEDEGAVLLAASPVLANLEDLDLDDNRLGETAAQTIAASAHLGKVRRLELRMNHLGPAGAEAVAGSERLAGLQKLGLANNEIGSSRLNTLSRTLGFLRVPVLDLAANQLQAAGLNIILNRSFGKIEPAAVGLRDLDLSYNDLGDQGMRVLAACPLLLNLQVLKLANCNIGNDGLRVLAESPNLRNLLKLELSNNPFSDTGCRFLLHTDHLNKLQVVTVSGIGISSDMRNSLDRRFRRR